MTAEKRSLAARVRALEERMDSAMKDVRGKAVVYVNLPDWIECLSAIAAELERIADEHRETLTQMDADDRCPVRYARKAHAWAAALADRKGE